MEILPIGVQNENKKKFYDEFLEQLDAFDPNHAHCFSPQEEIKLRKIMDDIGRDKLRNIKDEIMRMLAEKLAREGIEVDRKYRRHERRRTRKSSVREGSSARAHFLKATTHLCSVTPESTATESTATES